MPVNPEHVCACGKRRWPSKVAADRVVINAKISHALYGNSKRREIRSYECTVVPGNWHATSQPQRAAGAARAQREPELPDYATEDDEAAREFISRVVFEGASEPWQALYGSTYAHQTLRVLGFMHQAALAEQKRRRGEAAADARRYTDGVISAAEMNRRAGELAEWRRVTNPMAQMLASRIPMAKAAVKKANIIKSRARDTGENIHHREIVRYLTLAIARHRDEQDWRETSAADEELWAMLDRVHVVCDTASGPNHRSLADMITSGFWVPAERDDHPPAMPFILEET